jgi:hypothetical protein
MAMNLSQQIFRDLEKFGNEYKDNPAACKQPGKRLSAWILACSCLDPPEKRKWQNTLFSYTQFLLFGDANKNGELDDFFLQCVENSSSFMTFAAKVLATFDKPQNVNQVQILALGDQYNKPDLEKAIQNIFSQDQPGSPDLRSLLLSEKQSWETFLFVHAEAGNAHVNSIVKDCLKEWVEGLLPRILQRPPLDGDLPPPPPPAAANIPFPAGMVAVACMAPGQFVTKIEDVMDLRLLEKAAQMPVDAGKAGGRKILYGKHFMFMLVGSAYWAGRKTAKIWTAASNYKIGIDKVIAISKSLQDETDVMLYVRWKGLCFCPDEPMKGNFSKGDPDKHSFSPHRVKGAGNHLGNLYNPLAKIVCPIQDQVGQTKYKAIQFEDEWIKMDVIQLLGRDAILHVRLFFLTLSCVCARKVFLTGY